MKLVKLVEDKDSQVQKLSEKLDSKFEQVLKTLSELSVPKVVEKFIEKPGAASQEGGDKEGTEQTKPTDSEANKESTPKQPQQKQSHTSKPKRPIIKGVIINPPEGSSSKKPKPVTLQKMQK